MTEALKRKAKPPEISAAGNGRWDRDALLTSVVLELNGYSKGKALKPGVVGAILLPDEDLVLRAFEEEGKSQFPIEIRTAAFVTSSPYSASDQQRFLVGFPRYRIWLYNTIDTSVSTNLFVYLTN